MASSNQRTSITRLIVKNESKSDATFNVFVSDADRASTPDGEVLNVPISEELTKIASMIIDDYTGDYTVTGVHDGSHRVKLVDVKRSKGVIAEGDAVRVAENRLEILDESGDVVTKTKWPSDRYVVSAPTRSVRLLVKGQLPLSSPLNISYTTKKAVTCGVKYRGMIQLDGSVRVQRVLRLKNETATPLSNIQKVVVIYKPKRKSHKVYESSSPPLSYASAVPMMRSKSSEESSADYASETSLTSTHELEFDLYGTDLKSSTVAAASPTPLRADVKYFLIEGKKNPEPWVFFEDKQDFLELPFSLYDGLTSLGKSFVSRTYPSDSDRHTTFHTITFDPLPSITAFDKEVSTTTNSTSNQFSIKKVLTITNHSSQNITINYLVDAYNRDGVITYSFGDSSSKVAPLYKPPCSLFFMDTRRIIADIDVPSNNVIEVEYTIKYTA